MSEKTAKILLASVILARSSSYVLAKIGLTDIDVFNLMAIRFLMAFFIMFLLFHKRFFHADKASITAGLIVGAVYFVVMSFEVFSLKTCESSTTAFLENTAIVMVPLFEAILLRKLPLPKMIIGFVMAMTGVALMTLQGTSFDLTI
ncbi:MAG: EamA family transporter, partial [Peptococcaceae bacterium]|nr:EamA family transporter [Peptococcaceae bacterium]